MAPHSPSRARIGVQPGPPAAFSVGVGLLHGRQNCTAIRTPRRKENSKKKKKEKNIIGASPASRPGARAFLLGTVQEAREKSVCLFATALEVGASHARRAAKEKGKTPPGRVRKIKVPVPPLGLGTEPLP